MRRPQPPTAVAVVIENADGGETLVRGVGIHVVAVINEHAARAQRVDVRVVTVLIKGHQKIRMIAGGKDFACAHAYLENRRTARNGGGDRHVSHDVLVAAAGKTREKTADGLNAILRVAREADDRIGDSLNGAGAGGFGASRGKIGANHGARQTVRWSGRCQRSGRTGSWASLKTGRGFIPR